MKAATVLASPLRNKNLKVAPHDDPVLDGLFCGEICSSFHPKQLPKPHRIFSGIGYIRIY